MSVASASLQIDGRALELLGELLDSTAAQQEEALLRLNGSEPAVCARLRSMLAALAQAEGARTVTAGVLQDWHSALAVSLHRGDLLAGYRLLRPLGQGGMAAVWLAERADGSLKREVAIKVPLDAQVSGVLAERFARERDVLAALNHPNIARLYDAGVSEEGQPFIVLEHVPGCSITEYAARHQLDTPQRLHLFLQMLDAVEHAHRHMAVHRDLKPSNIMVTDEGSVKLLDFGIAKLLAPAPGATPLTQDASAVMTPRYAAPEQIDGRPITTTTDVHGAGVVLYELLSGRLPFDQPDMTLAQTVHAVLHQPPPALGLDADLDTVLQKALAKEPGQRYASVDRFAEDLRRVLAHEPILARRVSWWHRGKLLVRRQPRASAGLAAAVLVLLATATVAWQQHRESRAQEQRAATVQRFLVSMLADAEPDELQPDAEVSARSLVDAALLRARSDYATQPRVLGPLLTEIGRVYGRLGVGAAAIVVLEEAVQLQQSAVPDSDALLNRARVLLAGALAPQENTRAEALARAAQANCRAPGAECAQVRSLALSEIARLRSDAGHDEEALGLARQAIAETEAGFGAASADMVAALELAGLLARNTGRLKDAEQAIERAVATASGLTLRASDRVSLLRNQAVLSFDLGHYAEAAERLRRLLAGRAAPHEQITQWRVLAYCEWGLGHFDQAHAAAERSLALAREEGDAFAASLALQLRARVLGVQGKAAEAVVDLRQVVASLVDAGQPPGSFDLLRAQRLLAEVHLRSGDLAAAGQVLEPVLSQHAGSAQPQALEYAEALDLAGRLAAASRKANIALGQHRAARELLVSALPAEHPLLLRNALYAALAGAADASADAERYLSALPPDSAWRQRLRRWTAAEPARSSPTHTEVLVLG